MATTADYLTQLQADKQTLVDNLVAKGVEASNEETFTTLAPKVADIPSGGGNAEVNPVLKNVTDGIAVAIKKLPTLDASNCTTLMKLFYYCANLDEVEIINTQNVTNFSQMFMRSNMANFPMFDTSAGTNFSQMFYGSGAGSFGGDVSRYSVIPLYNTSAGTNFSQMFYFAKLKYVPKLDTSNADNVASMFKDLTVEDNTIPEFDLGKANKIGEIVYGMTDRNITTLGGFKDVGKAFNQTTENYYNHRLDLSRQPKLTRESIMNVINNLYDLNITYDVANGGTLYSQNLIIATECQALLSDDDIAIATERGWNVSFA